VSSRRRWLACLIVAVLLAIGLRAAHASRRPDHLYGDGQVYHRLAGQLLDEGYLGYSPDSFRSWRPPLYPTWLAGVRAVLGPRPFHAKLVECLLSGVIALLIVLIGRRLGLPWAGVLGALLYAVNSHGIRRDATLYGENSIALLVTILVLVSLSPRALFAGASLIRGIIAGLLIHLQPALVVIPLAMAAWTILKGRSRRHAISALCLVAGMILAAIPWTIRNYSVHGEVVFLTTNGGFNLLRGHNPHATGSNLSKEGIAHTQRVMQSAPESSTETDLDRWCRGKAVAWMRDNPRAAIRNTVVRLRNWWLPRRLLEPGSAWPVTYGVLFPFAVLGLIGILRRRIAWAPIWLSIIAASIPSFLVVYAGARYRTPVLPLIALLAGIGVLQVTGFARVLWQRR
jgi:hypothetical protein